MAKSEENFLTLENALTKKGVDQLVFRYAALSVHYRKPMEWSEQALTAARNGLEHLRNQVRRLRSENTGKNPSPDNEFKKSFLKAVNDDLNMPRALAAAQALLKSNLPDKAKLETILDFDKVLGLSLDKATGRSVVLPSAIQKLKEERQKARNDKNFRKADAKRTR